ncbi:methylated-DNA--[protein]-cysteine S-methyltransferase [Fibrobacterota bacterium]
MVNPAMDRTCFSTFATPLGKMLIAGDARGLIKVSLDKPSLPRPGWRSDANLFRREIKAIKEYLNGKSTALDNLKWNVGTVGTPFQRRVWKQLRKIPPGTTATYGEIASRLGNSRAARAVGGACNANPLMLLVPCHRVIGSRGRLTGFAGGLKTKLNLLKLENPAGHYT